MSLGEPADCRLSLIEETLCWGILDRRHLSETLRKPGCNLVAPLTSMPHSRVEQFGIFFVECNNLLYVMGIEGCNPAIHQCGKFLSTGGRFLWSAVITIRLQMHFLARFLLPLLSAQIFLHVLS